MNLAGLFQYGNRNTKTRSTETGKVQHTSSNSQSSHVVRNLSTGQTIQGEVVGKNGNEVQIRVDKDVVITAKLDADMNVSVGQSMTFEVKNNAGSQIALRPLYENMTQDANVLKALEAAKLPATNELVRMVSAMMERGMSIDKNTLMDMSKLVLTNPGTSPETLVMMKNLQIPITPENIGQFENYQSYEHQLLSNVTDILMELPNAFAAMAATGDGTAAINFYTQVLQLFTGMQSVEAEVPPDGKVFADIIGEGDGNGNPSSTPVSNGEGVARPEAGMLQEIFTHTEGKMSDSLLNLVGKGNTGVQTDSMGIPTDPQGESHPLLLSGTLDGGVRYQLAASLGKLGFSPEQQQQIQSGELPVEELLKEIHHVLLEKGNEVNRADIMKLFGSKEYQQILNRQIQQQWLMRPEDVSNKNEVEAFYHRLREQTARLTEAMGQTAKDTPLAKSLTGMQNNIDFMNQINQMLNYIQLPLKMSGGDAHGDLYVYTNRKSAVKEDGSVSALLHLDMEYLGPLDVYVMLKETKVNTQFYLQDESMIDFIADHIHVLNERLEKRGYTLHAEMKVAEEKEETTAKDVIKNITAKEPKTMLLAHYAFDVRA